MTSFEPADVPLESERGGTPADPFAADIAAARAGCEESLNRLFTACRPYLLLIANQELPPQMRAKMGGSDLVQETLLQVKHSFGRFRGNTEAELIAWLRGALLNNLQAETRRFRDTQKRALAREVSLDGGISDAELDGPADVGLASPGNQIVAEEEATRLHEALLRLPDDYRRVIELRNWEERRFAEIGELLGRSGEAARKLWARAVEQLKLELQRSQPHARED